MTAKEMYEIFQDFITNDFTHLRNRVDTNAKTTTRFFISLIIGLLSIVGGLIYLIVSK